MPPCALAWRRGRLVEIGGWRTDLLSNQDGELVVRAALQGIRLTSSNEGRAIYWHHGSPTRVSNTITDESAQNNRSIFRELSSQLQPSFDSRPDLRSAFSAVLHTLERRAAYYGLPDSQHEVHNFRRSLGFQRYHGSIAHRFASSLLGLRQKERLSRWLHAQRRRFWARGW